MRLQVLLGPPVLRKGIRPGIQHEKIGLGLDGHVHQIPQTSDIVHSRQKYAKLYRSVPQPFIVDIPDSDKHALSGSKDLSPSFEQSVEQTPPTQFLDVLHHRRAQFSFQSSSHWRRRKRRSGSPELHVGPFGHGRQNIRRLVLCRHHNDFLGLLCLSLNLLLYRPGA